MRKSRGFGAIAAAAGALALLGPLGLPTASQAAVSFGVSITIAPPPLPVYAQPPIPAPGYLWVPGYWAWGPGGYYWVPGTWVLPPEPGMLWTPGYWAWQDGVYIWHEGYWGPQVGFYGGIDYGFGYPGVGFFGGYWSNGVFFYNSAIYALAGARIIHFYHRPVVVRRRPGARVSYNGGRAGIRLRPTREQLRFRRERRFAPVAAQQSQRRAALGMPELRFARNRGRPPIGGTARPGEFTGRGVRTVRPATPAPRQVVPRRQPVPQRHAVPQRPLPAERQARPQPRPQLRPQPRPQPSPRQSAPQRRQVAPQPPEQRRQFAPQRQAPPQREARPRHPAQPQRRAEPQRRAQPQRRAEPHRRAPPDNDREHGGPA